MTLAVGGGFLLWERARNAFLSSDFRRGWLWTAGVVPAYLAALLSYETAVVLPGLLLFSDIIWNRRSVRSSGVRWAYGLLLVVTAVFLGLSFQMRATHPVDGDGFATPIARGQVALASAYFLMSHLGWWLWPFGRQEILGGFVP